MRVTRRKERDVPLSEYPGWAVDVMMGLYGERPVADAIAAETLPIHGESAEAADLAAVGSVFARLRSWRSGSRRG